MTDEDQVELSDRLSVIGDTIGVAMLGLDIEDEFAGSVLSVRAGLDARASLRAAQMLIRRAQWELAGSNRVGPLVGASS